MQLKLKQTQRTGMTGANIFCVDARVEFSTEEQMLIRKYKLGKSVLYNSKDSQRHLANFDAAHSEDTNGGMVRAFGSLVLAKMSLNISIESLERGQHIECKDMNELHLAVEAIMEGCKGLKGYLETAVSFDGREIIFDFSGDKATIVSHSLPSSQISLPPPLPASITGDMSEYAVTDDTTITRSGAATMNGAVAMKMAQKYGPFALVAGAAVYIALSLLGHH